MAERDVYARALDAEPKLRAIEKLVDALCTLVRPSDRLCYGCVWEEIVKPLVTPLVGWGRGFPPSQAEDPDPDRPLKVYSGSDLLASAARPKPTSETEEWLRSSEAFDVVTDAWLDRLQQADPAGGHGIGQAEVMRQHGEEHP